MGKIAALLLLFTPLFSATVTYEFSGGRFGDSLLCYLHAKWISYKYEIPIAYKPFALSLNLEMDRQEKRHTYANARWRTNIDAATVFDPKSPNEYICPYFPEDPWELKNSTYLLSGTPYTSFFEIDWKDPGFREAALAMIAPQRQLFLTQPQGSGIHIALHVREGGGYDDDGFRRAFPLKLPPLQFYIDGVLKMLELFPEKPLAIQVFTDAASPQMIVQKIKEQIPPGADIQFFFRKGSNSFARNILEDFFSLFLYDAIIRSQSNFSLIPSLLRDFAVVYAPKDCTVEDGATSITDVLIEINEPLYQELLR